MPQVSGPYDTYYVQPDCKIKENLSCFTGGFWQHYIVDYMEGISPGPASTVDMVTVAGATNIGALATIAHRIVPALQLDKSDLLKLRWEPLDFIEAILWQLGGQTRGTTRNITARVTPFSARRDPTNALDTFWVLGENRDMQLEVRNLLGTAQPCARVLFWGWRYVVRTHPGYAAMKARTDLTPADKTSIQQSLQLGDPGLVELTVRDPEASPLTAKEAAGAEFLDAAVAQIDDVDEPVFIDRDPIGQF